MFVEASCRCSYSYRSIISCSNSSLLECHPAVQAARVQIPAVTCLSTVGALVEDGDGDDLGQVSHVVPDIEPSAQQIAQQREQYLYS